MAELVYLDLGRAAYEPTLRLQRQIVEQVKSAGEERGYLLLVEHDPPVITLGRSGRGENILASPARLAERGIEVHETSRGGDVTCHGPGQLVGYPIVDLKRRSLGVRQYLRQLEEVLIRLLARLGVEGRQIEGLTGVWVGREKVAAIGVAITKWVTYHGFALNVSPDLSNFDLIVPCGISDRGVTSLERLLGRAVPVSELIAPAAECLAEVFGFDSVGEVSPEEAFGFDSVSQVSLAEVFGFDSVSEQPFDVTAQQRSADKKDDKSATHRRLPPWLTKRLPAGAAAGGVGELLEEIGLATVCSDAHCPNMAECYGRGTATFLILGRTCTRSCRFCAIRSGTPAAPAEDEPQAVAEACRRMGLRHVVITAVTRDDLPDGGAAHFARTIEAVRSALPAATVEVLTSDLMGDAAAVETVIRARPNVFNHNVETVGRLYSQVRPQADYRRSLDVLAQAKRVARKTGVKLHTKSGLMVGLGESDDEIRQVMSDLRQVDCDIITIGQYLAPSTRHIGVARYVEPAEFEALRQQALEAGFLAAAAGPFVRSSYRADELISSTAPASASSSPPAGDNSKPT